MPEVSILPSDYQLVLGTLKNRINQARYKSLSLVNKEAIKTYLFFGQVLYNKTRSGWGESVIDKISLDLRSEFASSKGLSARNLRRMRQVYELVRDNPIWTQAVTKIPWGHSLMIFSKIKNTEGIDFYLQKCISDGWTREVLEEEIRFNAFAKKNIQNNFDKTLSANQLIQYRLEHKDEYDLSFLELDRNHSERQLEDGMLKHVSKVLSQFGKDFCFMGRQFRLELDEKEYFIDLLFYHRKLKSLIAIELKTTTFKPEHSQQLNWYLHLLDKQVKYEDDNPTIGILLCKSKSRLTVEYALELVNHPIGVATYSYNQLPEEVAKYLPSEEELNNSLSSDFDSGNEN